jgi:hypothetical protein
MATNKKDLKAFVRYDGTGRIIPGSLILQRNKPKVGNWQQTNAYECCDPSCLPVTYNEQYIVTDIAPYDENNAVIVVLVEPSGNTSVQGALYDCNGKLLAISDILDTPFPGVNNWIVPTSALFASCSIKFRRICFNGNGHSNWSDVSF